MARFTYKTKEICMFTRYQYFKYFTCKPCRVAYSPKHFVVFMRKALHVSLSRVERFALAMYATILCFVFLFSVENATVVETTKGGLEGALDENGDTSLPGSTLCKE